MEVKRGVGVSLNEEVKGTLYLVQRAFEEAEKECYI